MAQPPSFDQFLQEKKVAPKPPSFDEFLGATLAAAPPEAPTQSRLERALRRTPGLIGEALLAPPRLAARVGAAGVSGIFRGLRAPQQFAVTGPALAAARGELTGPVSAFRAGVRGVREDVSFKDVAKAAGLPETHALVAGVVGDIALDPLWILTPAKVASVLRLPRAAKALSATGPVRRLLESRVAQRAGRALVYRFGQPEDYARLAEQHSKDVGVAVERAVEIGKQIAALPGEAQRFVRRYMEVGSDAGRQGLLDVARKAGFDADAIGRLGHEAMMRDVELGKRMVDVGIMSEQTFQRWAGKHIRREYTKHENPAEYLARLAQKDPNAAVQAEARVKATSGFVGESRPLRERFAFLRQRQDIPEDVRREMGEILEAAHPVAKGQALAGRAVATRTFFNEVAQKFSSEVAQPGYKYAGDAVTLGPLQGKYLPEAIADDINRVVRRPGEAERLWKQGVGWWKYGKVVLNPATHARNILSNLMLADFAGLQPFKVHRYAEAATSLRRGSHWAQEARGAGLLSTDFVGAELPRLLESTNDAKGLQKGLQLAVRGLDRAGDAYQFEEHLFKLAVYIDKRKAGLPIEEASRLAEEALFNYRKVPAFIDNLRSYGAVPFLTFPYKALPRVAKTIATKPATVGKYGDIIQAFEAPISKEERKVLPNFMQDGWMRLPGKDGRGRISYINLQYILPFGDIGEAATLGGFGGRGGAKAAFLSSPFVDLAAAIATDRDSFFPEREISKRPGGWPVWLMNYALPPLAGGYAARDIKAAIQGRPVDPLSKQEPRTLGQALLANLGGVRIRPVDLREEQEKRIRSMTFEIRDIQAEIRQVHKSKWLTDEERNQSLEENMRRIREIVKQIQEIAGAKLPQ